MIQTAADSEEIDEQIEEGDRQQAQRPAGVEKPGKDHATVISLNGPDDPVRYTLGVEDRQKPGKTGGRTAKHTGVDVVRTDYRCADCRAQPAKIDSQCLVETKQCRFAGTVVDQAGTPDDACRR